MATSRPVDEEALQKREVVGVFRASRFVREYAKSKKPITVSAIKDIHQEIFKDAWPEIAGRYREENITITGSDHLPPHWSEVPGLMEEVDARLKEYADDLTSAEGLVLDVEDASERRVAAINTVLNCTAYLHHIITYIHPFREGNGRTARLAGNLVLERYGFTGISIRVEKENKNRYLNALVQIDKHHDYEPLLDLIADGVIDRYKGVPMKFPRAA